MAELMGLTNLIADLWVDETRNQSSFGRLITRVGIDLKDNKVRVGACDPELVAPALFARFGPDAPLFVVYKPPLERKARKVLKPKSVSAPLVKERPFAIRDARRRPCGNR